MACGEACGRRTASSAALPARRHPECRKGRTPRSPAFSIGRPIYFRGKHLQDVQFSEHLVASLQRYRLQHGLGARVSAAKGPASGGQRPRQLPTISGVALNQFGTSNALTGEGLAAVRLREDVRKPG